MLQGQHPDDRIDPKWRDNLEWCGSGMARGIMPGGFLEHMGQVALRDRDLITAMVVEGIPPVAIFTAIDTLTVLERPR